MKFRKKPVIIEAIHYDGTPASKSAACNFLGLERVLFSDTQGLFINTLEGTMTAASGDWIIKGVKGEFYPCKPDIFEATYEAVDSLENAQGHPTGEKGKIMSKEIEMRVPVGQPRLVVPLRIPPLRPAEPRPETARECPKCHGSRMQIYKRGRREYPSPCNKCFGRGWIIKPKLPAKFA